MGKEQLTEEFLRQKYTVEGRTMRQIASETGTTYNDVRRVLVLFKVPIRSFIQYPPVPAVVRESLATGKRGKNGRRGAVVDNRRDFVTQAQFAVILADYLRLPQKDVMRFMQGYARVAVAILRAENNVVLSGLVKLILVDRPAVPEREARMPFGEKKLVTLPAKPAGKRVRVRTLKMLKRRIVEDVALPADFTQEEDDESV